VLKFKNKFGRLRDKGLVSDAPVPEVRSGARVQRALGLHIG
jgi:hypothetical protein